MSLSDDEEDFLSADEEGFGDENKIESVVEDKHVPTRDLKKPADPFEDKVLGETRTIQPKDKQVIAKVKSINKEKEEEEVVVVSKKADNLVTSEKPTENKPTTSSDDEETLAERIRERNLKIARKYSAELAKTVKASSPIPVKGAAIGFELGSDIEYPSIPYSESNPSAPPPAPPPTPLLSSSFNSDEPSSGSPSADSATSYGWRVPSKTKFKRPEATSMCDSKSDQARQALDRLSEKLSQSDKNLFEKVAEDLKKVSIKPGDNSDRSSCPESGGSIPIISDLGSTFGGWNWNSATKFLASASQVTSQVGSVIDSMVNVSNQSQHPASDLQQPARQAGDSKQNSDVNDNRNKQSTMSSRDGSASMSATDAMSNDALVDLTLNAMESLGKKAFGVMTERDESGSLQIKGLGRPWEHLLNLKKAQQPQGEASSSAHVHDLDESNISTTPIDSQSRAMVPNNETSTLKNRKRRFEYQDDGKLD